MTDDRTPNAPRSFVGLALAAGKNSVWFAADAEHALRLLH